VQVDDWRAFEEVFAGVGSKFVHAHWDGTTETELAIKEATKATIRCLPLDGEGPPSAAGRCVKTGKPSARRVLFAKNY
jgi:prolyl-tRNA synthetase